MMYNPIFKYTAALVLGSTLLSGCADDEAFEDPGNFTSNAGVISQKNFSILASNPSPVVVDPLTGSFTQTEVTLTAFIGDRNNQPLTNAHTVFFRTEYGLIEPNCITNDGTCSVTWQAIKRPDTNGPGFDGFSTIVAFTTGEESFTDTNGNGVFDDGDAGFDDLEEPYIDADLTFGLNPNLGGIFNSGDLVVDVVSTNDPSGINLVHDIADGFFNGNGCTHSSLCGIATSAVIWDDIVLKITGPAPAAQVYNISGAIAGLPAGETIVLQNNSANNLLVLQNSVAYTFATGFPDGGTYNVTVLTQPPSATCTVTNPTGTINGADATADITCI